jgi:hypothetical protein
MTRAWPIFITLLFPVTAAAIEAARMALPDDFRDRAERLQLTGFGGYNKGTWSAIGYQGEFTRGESRLGVFDPLYVANKGRSSFTFLADGADEPLDVSCEMRKKSVTINVVTFDPKKMNYDCEFRRAGLLTGDRLLLGQPKPTTMRERILANDLRVGEAIIDGRHLTMRSVHKYAGSPFTSQPPVGYLVDFDGTTVAAVELTDWNPAVYLRKDLDATVRETLLVAALAIAVLRDPAHSTLEDQAP